MPQSRATPHQTAATEIKSSVKKKKPTVDEILDKIRLGSINSITKEEKEILDNYSKQL